MNPADVNGLIVCFMVLAFMLWLTPDCNDQACDEAHNAHQAHERRQKLRNTAEANHRRWHRGTRVEGCEWCERT